MDEEIKITSESQAARNTLAEDGIETTPEEAAGILCVAKTIREIRAMSEEELQAMVASIKGHPDERELQRFLKDIGCT
jgi:hypothetical protein